MESAVASKDMGSVLTHIEILQKQLAEKNVELSETKQREEAARNQNVQLNALNEKLSEAKREAMREDFNNKVRGWVQEFDPKQVPEVIKTEFLNEVEKFVEKGNETGAWKVIFFLYCFLLFNPLTHPSSGVQCAQENNRWRPVWCR